MIQKNMQSLRVYYTDLYNILIEHQGEEIYRIGKNNGYYNLVFNNKFIHSKYNPITEATRWVDGLNIKNEEDCIFIIGLGLGYYLDHLVNKFPNKKIIIIEPSKEIFLHFLSVKDATSYIENVNIVFIVGKEANTIRTLFDYYIQNNKIKKIFYTELPIYRKLYGEYIEEIYVELKKVLLLLQGNLSTEICSSRRWLYNTLRNLQQVTNYNNITSLENLFTGIPVVIVSAGPSLEKNMHLLKDLYNKVLIIAVGTAASILDNNGIDAHIIMGVDGNPSESTIFKRLKSHRPLFLYAHMIHFEAIDIYNGDKMWMHIQGEKKLEHLFERIEYKCPSILSGGSIANTALAFAHWLKSERILFIGQDLAYTNKKLYATGSAHNVEELIQKEEGYIKEKDIYGNQVYTKSAFLTFKHWFEDYVKIKLQGTEIFNCTEGGLKIEGISNITFKEAINLYCNRTYNISELIQQALGKTETIPYGILENKIIEYKEQLINCLYLSKERVDTIVEIIEKKIYEVEQYNKKVDKVLEITSQIEEFEFYKIFIENTGKMYYEAITRQINKLLDETDDPLDKRKIILQGLLQQYNFAHDNIIVAKGAIEEVVVNGLF